MEKYYRIFYGIHTTLYREPGIMGECGYAKGKDTKDAFDKLKTTLPGKIEFLSGALCTREFLDMMYPEQPEYSTGNLGDYALFLEAVRENEKAGRE